MHRALVGSCNGTSWSPISCALCGIRTRVLAVADLTGDGKEEIVLIHADEMIIQWLTSESSYNRGHVDTHPTACSLSLMGEAENTGDAAS
jgi:hypothetical protein